MSSSPLPPLYDRWITELAGAPTAGEAAATCGDCAMVEPGPGLQGYDPVTKCCTYTPTLPNYLVGAALADDRLDELGGRDSLRRRIQARAGVTPLGLAQPPTVKLIAGHAQPAFGKAPRLMCEHYHAATGQCGIWLHRNAVCSTWFCKHDRGAVGLVFWHALRDLLLHVEHELSRHCVLELDAPYQPTSPDPAKSGPAPLTAHDLDGTVPDAEYAKRWGAWTGRELELYARCDALVRDLSWSDLQQIAGPELGLLARELARFRARREQPGVVPAALTLRRLEVLRDGDPVTVATYSGTDPIAIPTALLRILPVFRGQPIAEARQELATLDVDLDDDLLAHLVDYDVLADPREP